MLASTGCNCKQHQPPLALSVTVTGEETRRATVLSRHPPRLRPQPPRSGGRQARGAAAQARPSRPRWTPGWPVGDTEARLAGKGGRVPKWAACPSARHLVSPARTGGFLPLCPPEARFRSFSNPGDGCKCPAFLLHRHAHALFI